MCYFRILIILFFFVIVSFGCEEKQIVGFPTFYPPILDLNKKGIDSIKKFYTFLPDKRSRLRVEWILLNDNSIEEISEVISEDFINVRWFSFQNNGLKTIVNGAFKNMPNLDYVYLNKNLLEEIDPSVFYTDDSSNLMNLINLSENKISLINKLIQGDLARSIDLSKNKVVEISEDLVKGTERLEVLNLRENTLAIIPEEAFFNEGCLHEIYLGKNSIDTIGERAFYAKGLRKLDLSSNKLTEIPGNAFEKGNNIENLIISKNKISSIKSSDFDNLVNLKILKIDGNSFTPAAVTDDAFSKLVNLMILFIDLDPNEGGTKLSRKHKSILDLIKKNKFVIIRDVD